MSTPGADDWRPLSRPPRSRSLIDWDAPFPRLAVCHALSVSGETLVVLSLAGSFFFKVDPSEGREKVILGLLFTMAPFALIGPFIGPMIDRVRGGHRAVIQATMWLRAVVAVLMMIAVLRDSIALFPGAFAMLVLAKTYAIAKAAVVPSTVEGELELVEANSKLQLLGGLSATLAGAAGGLFLLISPAAELVFTSLMFTAAGVAALRLHPSITGEATEAEHRRHPDDAAVVPPDLAVAAFSMATLRFVVGFLTFMLAFLLRGGEVSLIDRAVHETLTVHKRFQIRTVIPALGDAPPSWYFGVVVAASVVGGLLGASLAPRARRRLPEERILLGAALGAAIVGVLSLALVGLGAYTLLSLGVAVAVALAKQAFDAVVQRDIPETFRGQLFARFEARFQIVWVLGALIPSVITLPVGAGSVVVAVAAAVSALALALGVRPVMLQQGPTGARHLRPYVSRSGKSGMSRESSSSGKG